MFRRCLAGACVVVFSTAGATAAQGLGALAAQTEAQRKTQQAGGRTFSNDNLPTQSRLDGALRDFELTIDIWNRLGGVHSAIDAARLRSPKLNRYLASFDTVGAIRPSLEEQAREFQEISDALDNHSFSPFTFEVAESALEQAVVDAARPDAELKTMPPARQARAAFARQWAQTLANGRWADAERKRQLPRPQ